MAVIHGANLQVDVHAVGDRGVDLTLDAFRTAAGSDREVARCRHRIEHFMFRRESRIRRAADLAVWNTDLRTVRTTAEVDRLQVVAMYVSGQPTWTVPPVPAPVDPSQWVKSHARFWLQVTLSNELAADAVCGVRPDCVRLRLATGPARRRLLCACRPCERSAETENGTYSRPSDACIRVGEGSEFLSFSYNGRRKTRPFDFGIEVRSCR